MDMQLLKDVASANGIPEPAGEQLLFLFRGFERAKYEILKDMSSGIVPSKVRSFDDLREFVDQPGDYGGFNTDEIRLEGVALFPPFMSGKIVCMGELVHYTKATYIVSAWIGRWLRNRSVDQALPDTLGDLPNKC
ncbi:hypothetical protein [Pseudomonas cedrina]|uniref:hypothetical protein n=1 Tax=Pseudomonas cedrina TaxID=651740 RepID=UPI0027891E1A|nr:hypothetical protein [Pseudomonas cedrina]MDQ0655129.1 hypothetical protein [Pseudomonas cedrina]